MNESVEILKELGDMVVKASNQNRGLSSQENEYFERMFEKALELTFLDYENSTFRKP